MRKALDCPRYLRTFLAWIETMNNDRIILWGISFLGCVAIVLSAGLVLLASEGRELPPSLAGALGTCLGALGAVLTGQRQTR